MVIVLSKVQDLALTIYPGFIYFTCCQVEIHGPARSSDALRVTSFACKREYFQLQHLNYLTRMEDSEV